MPPGKSTRVLFVCLGNICRSPTAHGVLASLLKQRGLTGLVEVDSCGTGGWHVGSPPDPRAVAAAAKRGYDLSHLRARQLHKSDFEHYHYLLAMDSDNLRELHRLCPPRYMGRTKLLLDYAPATTVREVPDPYYGHEDGFSRVLDLIEDACNGLLQEIALDIDPRR